MRKLFNLAFVFCLLIALTLCLASCDLPFGKDSTCDHKDMDASFTEVLEDHTGFEDVKITADIPSSITLIKKSKEGGYVISSTVNGKNSGLTILIGITPDGKIAGTKCTATNETPVYAEAVFEKTDTEGYYVGMNADTLETYIVSGSTLTSKAYGKAVSDALAAFAILVVGE